MPASLGQRPSASSVWGQDCSKCEDERIYLHASSHIGCKSISSRLQYACQMRIQRVDAKKCGLRKTEYPRSAIHGEAENRDAWQRIDFYLDNRKINLVHDYSAPYWTWLAARQEHTPCDDHYQIAIAEFRVGRFAIIQRCVSCLYPGRKGQFSSRS